jgi:hypothetical protein
MDFQSQSIPELPNGGNTKKETILAGSGVHGFRESSFYSIRFLTAVEEFFIGFFAARDGSGHAKSWLAHSA